MCDPPRIYPFLPEYTPLFNQFICATLPEYTPLFSQFICATLPESTPPSQNIPPFSTNLYVRSSQNLPLPPRIYPPFQQMYICDPPRIYLSVPENTPFFTNYMRPSQNLPLPEYTPPSQNIPPFQQLCATLLKYTPPS